MFVSHVPPAPAAPRHASMLSQRPAEPDLPLLPEDGCIAPRPPLRSSDRGLWCAAAIITAATGWLLS